jgi:hypothetical protein
MKMRGVKLFVGFSSLGYWIGKQMGRGAVDTAADSPHSVDSYRVLGASLLSFILDLQLCFRLYRISFFPSPCFHMYDELLFEASLGSLTPPCADRCFRCRFPPSKLCVYDVAKL